MGMPGDFVFEIDEGLCDGDMGALSVTTPSGKTFRVLATMRVLDDRTLELRDIGVYGVFVAPGEIGAAAMRQAIYAAMEVFDVDCIRIEEARRYSGAGPGRAVRPIEFRRRGR
jgi:hypothetical protein